MAFAYPRSVRKLGDKEAFLWRLHQRMVKRHQDERAKYEPDPRKPFPKGKLPAFRQFQGRWQQKIEQLGEELGDVQAALKADPTYDRFIDQHPLIQGD